MSQRINVWEELGIPPTEDIPTIRRAYAERLRERPPETDANAFQRLRASYEVAMRLARGAAQRQSAPGPPASGRADAESRPSIPTGPPSGAVPPVPGPIAAPAADARAERPPTEPLASSHSDTKPALPSAPLPKPGPAILERVEAPAIALRAESDLRDLAEAVQALRKLLMQPATPPDTTLSEALDAVIESPGALQIGVWGAFDHRLAELLMKTAPRSDVIAARAADRLGWSRTEVGVSRPPSVQAVLSRLADSAALATLEASGRDNCIAVGVLKRSVPNHLLERRWYALRHAGRVASVFRTALVEHVTLEQRLDPGTVAWWRSYLSRPRFTRGGAYVGLLVLLYAGLAVALDARFGSKAGPGALRIASTLAVGPAAAVTWLYGIRWPIWLARRLMSDRTSMLVRHGWAPAFIAVVGIAALLPVHTASLLLSAALSFGVGLWAVASLRRTPADRGVWNRQTLRAALVGNAASLLWAVLGFTFVPLQVALAGAAAIGASVANLWVSLAAWRFRTPWRLRQAVLLLLGALAILSLVMVWVPSSDAVYADWIYALVVAQLVLSRPPRWSISAQGRKYFAWSWQMLWVAAIGGRALYRMGQVAVGALGVVATFLSCITVAIAILAWRDDPGRVEESGQGAAPNPRSGE